MSDEKLTFSQRQGLKPSLETADLVVDGITDEIRTAIWNVIQPKLLKWPMRGPSYPTSDGSPMPAVYKFLNWPIDEINGYWPDEVAKFKSWFFSKADWNEVYDFTDFLGTTKQNWYWIKLGTTDYYNFATSQGIRDLINNALKINFSGYRFVGDEILPITDEIEIAEIEQATSISNPYSGARTHIKTAKTKLKEHDYRNCITESIHAVDSVLSLHSKNPKSDFQIKTREFFNKFGNPHPQFDQALTNLYNYTSDEEGLRHQLISKDDASVEFENAKYFLVICSALVNYLIQIAEKSN